MGRLDITSPTSPTFCRAASCYLGGTCVLFHLFVPPVLHVNTCIIVVIRSEFTCQVTAGRSKTVYSHDLVEIDPDTLF